MQNPGRFGFESMNSLSNPDVFRITFKEGSYYIEKSIEAKTHLDGRTRHQLSENGFRRSIRIILNKVNSLQDASQHGLDGLGEGGHPVKISDEYKQFIIIPRKTKLTSGAIGRSIGTKYAMNDEQTDLFSHELQEMESKGLLLRSCFSNDDISAITKFFYNEINERRLAQKRPRN